MMSTNETAVWPGRKEVVKTSTSWSDLLERAGLVLLLLAVIVTFSILEPNTFPTAANWRSIATSQPVLGVAALALILPLIGGRFDISVGANLALCSIVTAASMSHFGLPLGVACIFGIATGLLIGLINGLMVAYLGVNSIIATLGVSTVLGGVITGYTGGIPISSGLSSILTDLSIRAIAGIPVLFILMVVIAVLTWLVLNHTVYGRYLTAVGANQDSARLAGIQVPRVVMMSFVASGGLAGVAGIMQIGAQGNADPSLIGITYMLPALAAAFLGATTWHPGRYNVPGTIVGLFFLGTTISGLSLIGTDSWITDVFNGLAVVVAIALSAQLRRRRTGISEIGK